MAAHTGTRVTTARSSAQRRFRAAVVGGGVAGLVVVLAGCGGAEAEDAPVESKKFPLAGKTLTVDSDDSRIDLVAADVKDVEVTRQVDGWVFLGSGPEATWKMKGDRLTLRVKCAAVASDCEARHTVKVPRDVAVTVEDDNGGVTAGGFRTPLTIRSDNGAVEVRDSSGALDLVSDNGKVVAQGVTARTVKARSENGGVELGLAAVPDTVETVSDNGRVVIELPRSGAPYAVTAKSDNGGVDVDVPTDAGSSHVVKARSDNGKVTVRSAN
ncbi:DUF4097 family beta strand repeat-containing protein [Streptomyces sp. NPDC008141]|uniref:DUF4097 family beta strand repeat-containing protein n=1 Tax=Streptomyces sp. NPDC008141 TaxID=3364815 RepID=UPI0036EB2145